MDNTQNFENAVDVTSEPKKECQTCKKSGGKLTWTMLILSFYVLFSSIYGTVKLFKEIISFF